MEMVSETRKWAQGLPKRREELQEELNGSSSVTKAATWSTRRLIRKPSRLGWEFSCFTQTTCRTEHQLGKSPLAPSPSYRSRFLYLSTSTHFLDRTTQRPPEHTHPYLSHLRSLARTSVPKKLVNKYSRSDIPIHKRCDGPTQWRSSQLARRSVLAITPSPSLINTHIVRDPKPHLRVRTRA